MIRLLLVLMGISLMISCKSKQQLFSEQSAVELKNISNVVKGHYSNKKDFNTANFKVSARYEDEKQTQNVTAEIRIKKNEKILVIVRFFGITMAKAMITPDRVSYYEKINGKYFEGNYKVLSDWLGTDLDFSKVQNLFLGQALNDLTKGSYAETLENGQYVLRSKGNQIQSSFFFEGSKFLLKNETFEQKGEEPRSLEIRYPAYKELEKGIYPAQILIDAFQKEKVTIKIDYNNITFDENLSFSYQVPEGFDQIFID